MRLFNRFLISLAVAFGIANVALALTGQARLDTYFIIDAIIFFVLALYFNLGTRAMLGLRGVGAFIIFGFAFLVILRIIEML